MAHGKQPETALALRIIRGYAAVLPDSMYLAVGTIKILGCGITGTVRGLDIQREKDVTVAVKSDAPARTGVWR